MRKYLDYFIPKHLIQPTPAGHNPVGPTFGVNVRVQKISAHASL
ncbi:MAG: hypothetical protein WCY58_10815 [Mariniphaga sp.]|nr:hypothetical protein [Mariniphaga sp.]